MAPATGARCDIEVLGGDQGKNGGAGESQIPLGMGGIKFWPIKTSSRPT